MEKKIWLGILIASVVVVLCLFSTVQPRKPSKTSTDSYEPLPPANPPCGCVFDIDQTLTCGDPRKVVQMCKDNGCVFGLNTARNTPYAGDVPLKDQGFPPNVLNGEDFVYNPNPTSANVVATKVAGLQRFQHKWKIDSPGKILFFDDSLPNIEGANAAGFKGVWCPAGGGQCGICTDQEVLADTFLREAANGQRAGR